MSKATLQALRDEFQAAYATSAAAVRTAHKLRDLAALTSAAVNLSGLVEQHGVRQLRELFVLLGNMRGPVSGATDRGQISPRLARLAFVASMALWDLFEEFARPQAEAVDGGPVATDDAAVLHAALLFGGGVRNAPSDDTGNGMKLRRLMETGI